MKKTTILDRLIITTAIIVGITYTILQTMVLIGNFK